MKMIMRFLKDYKKECVLAPLFKMLEAIFELFVPLVVSSVIDKGIVNADKGYIMQMCFMLDTLLIENTQKDTKPLQSPEMRSLGLNSLSQISIMLDSIRHLW